MLILAIDIGNTRIKWGLSNNTNWLDRGAASSNEHAVLAGQWAGIPAPGHIIISSVAHTKKTDQVTRLCQSWPTQLQLITAQATQCGVRNGYDDPTQLGSDRWAALVGARHLFPGRDLLVVQSGTATTIDTLDASGFFPGGLILPGVQLMWQALTQGAAKLGLQQGKFNVYPRNTADAMQSGILNAIAGGIERRFRLLKNNPLCLLSGGDADILLPLLDIPTLDIPIQRVDDLVLEGIILIAQEGSK
ncbi:MAG: type III pantothenate kinase [Sulfuricellaceae bacterium]|nr:type III pantothenate kinase [Sulfuricellaceae bacterium]